MFKRRKNVWAVLCIAAIIFMGSSPNPPNGNTGAPGDGQCTGCHGGGGGGFDGDITLSGLPSNAVPNQTYTLTLDVDVTMGSPNRAGFQVVALFDSDDSNAGTLSNPGGSSTVMNDSGSGRDYWEHNPAVMFGGGTNVSWDVEWTAPNVTDGITFYMASILGNGSGSGGDKLIDLQEQTSVMASNPITINFLEFSDPFCSDGTGSFVIASPSNGVSPYTFLWSNGSTDDFLENVPAGTYSVTVTDDTGATGEDSVTFQGGTDIISDPLIINVTCNGDADGEVELEPQGGVGTVDCIWEDGFQGCERDMLEGGTYVVEFSDEVGCTGEVEFDIEEPDELEVILEWNDAGPSGNDGVASATAMGGTGPFDFEWSTGDTETAPVSSVISDLAPGTYSVTVVDDNDCETSGSVFVGGVGCNLNVAANVSNISCAGLTDGAINLSVSGASGPLSYIWSNGATISSLDSLMAGAYSVEVSDGSCDTTLQMTVTNPDTLEATIIILAQPSCANTNNGRLGLALSGGDENYTLTWNTGQTNDTLIMGMDTLINYPDTLNALGTGMYIYELVDGNGCTFIDSVFLDNGDNLLPFIMINNSFVVELDANGTHPAFTFEDIDQGSFDNCGIDSVAFSTPVFDCSHIGTNIYPVEIFDTNNNVANSSVEIVVIETVPPVIDCAASAVTTNSCGAVTYVVPTATDNCDIPNVTLTSGLASGSFFPSGTNTITYTAADECGNTAECSFNVIVSNDLVASIASIQNAGCNSSTGSVEIAVAGGTPPYAVEGFGSLTQTGLAPGNYSVDVSDAAGCVTTLSFVIEEEISDLAADLDIQNVTCAGLGDGSINVTALGGVAPYSIDFGGVDEGNLPPGTYQVFITDALDCSIQLSYTIEEPEMLSVEILDSGFDMCTGLFSENDFSYDVMGGIAPYSLSFISMEFDMDTLLVAVDVGILDSNNCETSVFVSAPEVTPIEITNVEIVNQSDVLGFIGIDVTGGTGDLSYEWFDETGNLISNDEDISSLSSGTYTVQITDSNGCAISQEFFVDIESAVIDLDRENLWVDIYPNPAVDLLKVEFKKQVAHTITVYNTAGQFLLSFSDLDQNTNLDMQSLSSGLHILKMEFEEKVVVKNFIIE